MQAGVCALLASYVCTETEMVDSTNSKVCRNCEKTETSSQTTWLTIVAAVADGAVVSTDGSSSFQRFQLQ